MGKFIEEAGAIVLRKRRSSLDVLLILTRKKPCVRIFPKGHIEPGENSAAAAKRELMEEAGVVGNLLREAGTVTYEFRGKNYRVVYYFFQFDKQVSDGEQGRDPQWFSIEEAKNLLPFHEIKQLLTQNTGLAGASCSSIGNTLPDR
jgi:8-oxo-dGTP pyrophosphatase MutT (NUDIX family)